MVPHHPPMTQDLKQFDQALSSTADSLAQKVRHNLAISTKISSKLAELQVIEDQLTSQIMGGSEVFTETPSVARLLSKPSKASDSLEQALATPSSLSPEFYALVERARAGIPGF